MIVKSTSIYYRGCYIFLCCIYIETNGCKIWAFAGRLWSQFKQDGHSCSDTGPRFLRSHPKHSLDPKAHRHLGVISSFLCYKQYLHPTSMKTVIKASGYFFITRKNNNISCLWISKGDWEPLLTRDSTGPVKEGGPLSDTLCLFQESNKPWIDESSNTAEADLSWRRSWLEIIINVRIPYLVI